MITKYALLGIAYVGIFFSINIIHFHFFSPSVILYSLLFDIFLALIFLIIIILFLHSKEYLIRDILLTTFFLISVTLSLVLYAFVIPTAIDRSLSVYLLEKIETNNGSMTIAELDKIAREDYFDEMLVVDVRIDEQLATGSIEVIGDKVVITSKGKKMLTIFSFVKTYLLPDKND